MKTAFRSLVRFKSTNGTIYYGEAGGQPAAPGQIVKLFSGGEPWALTPLDEEAEIAEILCPLASTPIIYGIGLNYKQHIAEAGFPTPEYPTVFTKPPGALAGPYESIPVDAVCTNLDYEGELVAIIGRDVRNFNPQTQDYRDFLLGYTAGNDVSSRFWQIPDRCGGQHGYAKSFDRFAPIGPVIVSTEEIPDVAELKLTTKVNGELRQETSTGDLLFTIPRILEHLSRGTTVAKGTIIMTGTPSGVAAFMKPPAWLGSGDVVTVEISRIGKVENTMVIS